MKTPLLLAAVAVFSLQAAWADWVILQKTTTDGENQEVSIKVKGDRTRMDVGKQMTILADSATSQMTMLMHEQKMLMKMNSDMLKGVMALAGSALGADKPAAKPVATGQKEKVGAYDCEVYTWSGQLGTGKFWVAKDFKGFQELNAVQDKMMKAMGSPAAALAPQSSDFPGMVIKSEMQVMGKTSVSELVSAKEEAVDAAVFAVPAGYQEMKMPGLPSR